MNEIRESYETHLKNDEKNDEKIVLEKHFFFQRKIPALIKQVESKFLKEIIAKVPQKHLKSVKSCKILPKMTYF